MGTRRHQPKGEKHPVAAGKRHRIASRHCEASYDSLFLASKTLTPRTFMISWIAASARAVRFLPIVLHPREQVPLYPVIRGLFDQRRRPPESASRRLSTCANSIPHCGRFGTIDSVPAPTS